MALRFAEFHLMMPGAKSRKLFQQHMASPLVVSGVTELRDNIISCSKPLTEHQYNIGFPLLHNLFIHTFILSYYFSFSPFVTYSCPNFWSFGENVRFDPVLVQIAAVLAGASISMHQCSIGLHKYRNTYLSDQATQQYSLPASVLPGGKMA